MHRRDFMLKTSAALLGCIAAGCGTSGTPAAEAVPARQRRAIDTDFFAAMERLSGAAPGARRLAGQARGVLCFPTLRPTGPEGEYGGEGVLRVADAMENYYRVSATPAAPIRGTAPRTLILLFMNEAALESLRAGREWAGGADVAVVKPTPEGGLAPGARSKPVLALVLDARGTPAAAVLRRLRVVPLAPA